MHFVAFRFEPIEKSFDSVPEPIFPKLFAWHPWPFTIQYPILILLRELCERRANIELAFRRAPEQVALTFATVFRLERFDHAAGDA